MSGQQAPSEADLKDKWQQLNEQVINCRKCARLVEWREAVAATRKKAYKDWDYWGKPVPGFGDRQARILIVGLAPGAHGSNRTGRMFTGDASGVFLFSALHRAGFANQPTAINQDDGLQLSDLFISAVCRCAPPDNQPTRTEMENCRPFLLAEMDLMPRLEGIVALGRIAFDNMLDIFSRRDGVNPAGLSFGHGAFYRLGENLPWLLTSFHPSRQNTQTGRLTVAMFDQIWSKARRLLDEEG
ncbi:MAG: uracil-DNA glycosylase [Anaerolineaceae bacterium]|nr:uracil-DNA glycosylase [Anaerolineaceae bacterium]